MQFLSYIAGMFSLPRISAACLLLSFVGAGGASGCLYDSSNRCDPGQSYDPGSGLCICAAGSNTITGDHGCTPCGDHEVAANDACTCDVGYQRSGGSGPCVIVPTGLGDPCTADADCTVNALFATCQMTANGGYCTNINCASDDDCTGGYACNSGSDPAFCQRPPTGQDMPCTAQSDCAGKEASYCLTIQAQACFVECTVGGNECFSGRECCDLDKLSSHLIPKQLCVPTGTCHL